MDKIWKYVVIGGVVPVILISILEIIILNCKGSGCFGFLFIGWLPFIPGTFLEVIFGISTTYSLILFNLIFYFVFGGFIGWIVWRIKKK